MSGQEGGGQGLDDGMDDGMSSVGGRAPWLRDGVSMPYGPMTAEGKTAQVRMEQRMVRQEELSNQARVERRAALQEELEAERVQGLEKASKIFFIVGCFMLPWVHMIMWIFFWPEWKDPDASRVVKKNLKRSLYVALGWTAVFTAWFIVFQVLADQLSALNVLSVTNLYF
ncbi:hypothetical protein NDN08_001174 [Rhodosorus marinus]|uniref:Gamma-secretase subunit PEN-2 n=1 Tax=Rhodosorus marinus TaxID=101924 RepID=A0AAV8UQ59_9RHOD|nr:hypothetical protein NDN08_001174 [Rhodosorus marinus]